MYLVSSVYPRALLKICQDTKVSNQKISIWTQTFHFSEVVPRWNNLSWHLQSFILGMKYVYTKVYTQESTIRSPELRRSNIVICCSLDIFVFATRSNVVKLWPCLARLLSLHLSLYSFHAHSHCCLPTKGPFIKLMKRKSLLTQITTSHTLTLLWYLRYLRFEHRLSLNVHSSLQFSAL